jgi:hypothetical protein
VQAMSRRGATAARASQAAPYRRFMRRRCTSTFRPRIRSSLTKRPRPACPTILVTHMPARRWATDRCFTPREGFSGALARERCWHFSGQAVGGGTTTKSSLAIVRATNGSCSKPRGTTAAAHSQTLLDTALRRVTESRLRTRRARRASRIARPDCQPCSDDLASCERQVTGQADNLSFATEFRTSASSFVDPPSRECSVGVPVERWVRNCSQSLSGLAFATCRNPCRGSRLERAVSSG